MNIYIIILYINLSDQIVLNRGYKLDINILYTNKIKKIKKYVLILYFIFQIKIQKNLQMMLIFFLKIIFNFLIINLNCIISIYKLYILIF